MPIDWFDDFAAEHLARHPNKGLPPVGTAAGDLFYEGWRRNFELRGLRDYDVATEASERLQAVTHYRDDHLGSLLTQAQAIYRERAESRLAAVSGSSSPSPAESEARRLWASLDEPEREAWRGRVRARFPDLAQRAGFVEAVATGWNADPSLIPTGPAGRDAAIGRPVPPKTGEAYPKGTRAALMDLPDYWRDQSRRNVALDADGRPVEIGPDGRPARKSTPENGDN